MGREIRRVAVLYAGLSGYITACLKTLKEQYGVELLVYHFPASPEAPYDERTFDWIDERYTKEGGALDELKRRLEAFRPDVVLMSGWMEKEYLRAARWIRARGVPVVAGSDTQWSGSLRQHAARLLARRYLHAAIDVLWVPGERQRQYAKALGYTGSRCWSGIYACDWARFAAPEGLQRSPAFLYVGRYVDAKGLNVLVEGYRQYRARVREPWALWCAGTGPQGYLLESIEGVTDLGFIQPGALPKLMHRASAFVLPSRWEPWGVVVQEAAAARLPLICSAACGAAVHLLQDGYNGFLFGTGRADDLARCMVRISAASPADLERMGAGSFELSKQFTPSQWAQMLIERGRDLLGERTRSSS